MWTRGFATVLAAAYALLALSSIAVVVSEHRIAERQDARTLQLSTEDRTSDVFVRRGQDVWHDRLIHVEWIDPAGDRDAALVPPGLKSFPEAGAAAVSPALAALIHDDPALAAMYPRAAVIGDAGVGSSRELVAYVTPPPGRGLGGEDRALRFDDGRVVGDRVTLRVAGFGGAGGLDAFADDSLRWWLNPLAGAALGLLCAVASLVVASGAVAARPGTDPRPRHLLTLLPGLASGCIVWFVWVSRTEVLPLTPVPSAQGLDESALILACWGLLSVAVLLSLALVGRRSERPPRTRSPRLWSDNLLLAPLAVSGVLFAAHQLTSWGDLLPAVAFLCALVGSCTALPLAMRAVGHRISKSPSPRTAILGAAMSSGPGWAARPFYALSLLIVAIMPFLPSTLLGVLAAPEANAQVGPSAVAVEWLEVRPGDFSSFRSQLDSAEGFLVQAAGHDHSGHDHSGDEDQSEATSTARTPPGLLVEARCGELAAVVDVDCDKSAPWRLGGAAQADALKVIGPVVGVSSTRLTLVAPGTLPESGSAVVIGGGDLASVDAEATLAARQTLPAALVESGANFDADSRQGQALLNSLVQRFLMLVGVVVAVVAVQRCLSDRVPRGAGPWKAPTGTARGRLVALRFVTGWWSAGLFATVIGCLVRANTSTRGLREAMWQSTSIVWMLIVGTVVAVLALALAFAGAGPGRGRARA